MLSFYRKIILFIELALPFIAAFVFAYWTKTTANPDPSKVTLLFNNKLSESEIYFMYILFVLIIGFKQIFYWLKVQIWADLFSILYYLNFIAIFLLLDVPMSSKAILLVILASGIVNTVSDVIKRSAPQY
jgi:hypothetical protein